MAREVNQLLCRVFAQRHKDGRTDLEAVESALRAALHQAGAAALSELLQFAAPAADQRQLPCRCGHHAQYQEIRSKPVLTIVGPVRLTRPYYLCSRCQPNLTTCGRFSAFLQYFSSLSCAFPLLRSEKMVEWRPSVFP